MSAATRGRAVVAAAEDLPPGATCTADLGGRPVVVTNVDGHLVAVDGVCPHAGGPLGEGRLDGGLLQCPWHRALFDLRTGAPCRGPARKPLRRYPVRVDGGLVVVTLD